MKTPQQSYPELATALGVEELYLKREDLHKYLSHKGRSIPLMIKRYVREAHTHFVISSSGNAALAAALTVENHNRNNPEKTISLDILVGLHIQKEKLKALNKIANQGIGISIKEVERPKQNAFQMAKTGSAIFLRQSTDDLALEGYLSLAEELAKIPQLEAVFIPSSSGTTAQALGEAFGKMSKPIQTHVVQTTRCHPIAEIFDKNIAHDEKESAGSKAKAIVDNIAHRKDKVVYLVQASGGSGWIITNDEIEKAQNLVREKTGLSISANSALSVAGLKKALFSGWNCKGTVACIITGA